jgi:hypothetical protein
VAAAKSEHQQYRQHRYKQGAGGKWLQPATDKLVGTGSIPQQLPAQVVVVALVVDPLQCKCRSPAASALSTRCRIACITAHLLLLCSCQQGGHQGRQTQLGRSSFDSWWTCPASCSLLGNLMAPPCWCAVTLVACTQQQHPDQSRHQQEELPAQCPCGLAAPSLVNCQRHQH